VANEDKATRYHRLRRRAALASTILSALILIALLVSGGSAGLRDAASALAGGRFWMTVVLYVMALVLASDLLQLPLAFYQGVTLERRYGLSTETTWRWWRDHLKASTIALLFTIAAALIIAWLLRWTPEWWWIVAAGSFIVILICFAQLAPVLLLPLFYDFKPLDRAALVDRLLALADRAGTNVLGVFEWRLSERTRKANAALAGIGRTRRILVSDTLLAEHSDDEIEVILAHELAHHVHSDIWRAIALESALIVFGLFVADSVLSRFAAGAFGLTGKADVAALPMVVLTLGAISLALLPVANAFSRAHERRADRYALHMTRNVPAFVSAMKRLGAQNLAEERPSRIVELLFHSHPPIRARIAAAHAWSRENGAG
jgi:STE24 endopeptidase